MRNDVELALPREDARELLASLSLALAAVDDARILEQDLIAAGRVGLSLRAHRGHVLDLSARAAENLLALCDAVHDALDPDRVTTEILRCGVDAFGTFRRLIHCACSAPRHDRKAVA